MPRPEAIKTSEREECLLQPEAKNATIVINKANILFAEKLITLKIVLSKYELIAYQSK